MAENSKTKKKGAEEETVLPRKPVFLPPKLINDLKGLKPGFFGNFSQRGFFWLLSFFCLQ